jgi:hypothetical protein
MLLGRGRPGAAVATPPFFIPPVPNREFGVPQNLGPCATAPAALLLARPGVGVTAQRVFRLAELSVSRLAKLSGSNI